MWEGINKIINHVKQLVLNVASRVKQLMLNVASSKSKTFLAFCFCFILGSGGASLFNFSAGASWYIYFSLFFLIALLVVFWGNRRIWFFVSCILVFTFGLWRYSVTIPDCHDFNVLCSSNGKKVNLVGVVSEEPAEKVTGISYTVKAVSLESPRLGGGGLKARGGLADAVLDSRSTHPYPVQAGTTVSGKITLTNKLYPSFSYGDKLKISCRLETPSNQDNSTFHYDKYLARFGVWSICSFPLIEKISGDSGNIFMEKLLALKSTINQRLKMLWQEPEGSLMAGLLYGARSTMPQYLLDDFSRTGVSHVVAVSGFNITIVVVIVANILIYLGLRRQHSFYVVLTFTILFVIFTGFSASAVRAAIMGMVVLLAQQIGRSSRMASVLVFTVALMQLMNPYLLIWDAGFQLSFLATLGLVYVSPALSVILSKAKDPLTITNARDSSVAAKLPLNDNAWSGYVYEPLVTTLSAIIATFPIIMYQFGTFSIVALLVNILILWIVPLLMLLGAVSLGLSFVFFPLGALVASLARFGLYYVIMIVRFFGEKSWASANVPIPWWGMVGMYVGIYLLLKTKTPPSRANHN